MIRFRAIRRLPLARRLVAWVLLATYATTASGVSLPTWAGRSAAGEAGASPAEPYPCQAHRCGCATAEQCWKSCCCFTNGEKVAWATQHGVRLPGFVVAAARIEQTHAAAKPKCTKAEAGCCRAANCGLNSGNCSSGSCSSDGCSTAGCSSGGCSQGAIARACGTSQAAACESADVSHASSPAEVSLWESQRCRGTTPTWAGVVISLPPAPPVDAPAFDLAVSRTAAGPTAPKPHVFSSPSVPPPRAT